MARRNCVSVCVLFLGLYALTLRAQEKPSEAAKYSKEAYVFELLRTRVRFEPDGTGRREVTGRVRIQSESATRDFGLLKFPYAASFESLEINYVRVRKPDGSSASTPASEAQDLDSEVSRQAPMYTDDREKHIAVKGLGTGDILEYQVTWTVREAIAPGRFWLDDNFLGGAICLDEEMEFDVPSTLQVRFVSGKTPPVVTTSATRKVYTLHSSNLAREDAEDSADWEKNAGGLEPPVVRLSSFASWDEVGKWFGALEKPQMQVTPPIQAKAEELTKGKTTEAEKIQSLYDFVAQRFRYIGISLGHGRYTPHRADEVLANRYGDCKDKHTLFAALLAAAGIKAYPALISSSWKIDSTVPSPSLFDHVITAIPQKDSILFLDTTAEVARFGYLLPILRDKQALVIADGEPARLVKTPANPPDANFEAFEIEATLDAQGTLDGKAKLESRGDSELKIRAAFRAVSESRWKDLVQAISGMMGFGGTVSEVSAARPEETGKDFWFTYSYHRAEYSNWKQRQISLPMPPVVLPALAEKRKNSPEPLLLGSPLEVRYEAKVTLPKGMNPVLPPSVNIQRDFATYKASYVFENGVIRGVRQLKTLKREIPGSDRAAYSEFVEGLIADQNHYMALLGGPGGISPLLGGNGTLNGIDPNGHSENKDAQQLYDEARESLQLGAPRAAISALERALKLEPKWGDAWLLLGGARMMANQVDPAIEAFRKATVLDESNVAGYRALAMAFTSKHDDTGAIQAWRDLLKVSPDNPEAFAALPPLLERQGNYVEALPMLQKAAEENGSAPGTQIRLAQALLHLNNEDEAMTHFRKALDLDSDAQTLNSVAYSLAQANRRLTEALHFAEEAVEKTEERTTSARWEAADPSNLGLMGDLAAQWDTLGWVKFRMHEFQAALRYLESAWYLMPATEVGDHLAQNYEMLGRKEEALKTYRLVLETLPSAGDSQYREKISTKITSLSGNSPTRKEFGLSELRSYRVPEFKNWGGGYKSANFTITFTKGPTVQSVQFRDGAEELREASDALSELKFHITFPDDGPTRIVRLGILSCSAAAKGCTFAFIPVQQYAPGWSVPQPTPQTQ